MIVIGEKINSKVKTVKQLMECCDTQSIQEIAVKQYEAGATYIDINADAFGNAEPEKLEWLANTIQSVVNIPFSIDSTNTTAIEKVLKINKNGKPIINSLTYEDYKINSILPLVTQYNTAIIALCMDDSGMPETVDERIEIAGNLVNILVSNGVPMEDIYLDPMVRAIGSGSDNGKIALESISRLRKEFPGTHVTCGISNISFGIPSRKLMNQAFLISAMAAGLDSGILDPLDQRLMAFLYAGKALLGVDTFCMEYLMKFREGLLEI